MDELIYVAAMLVSVCAFFRGVFVLSQETESSKPLFRLARYGV